MVGPRMGRFGTETTKKLAYRGHSSTLTGVGAFLLMLGILGYNMSAPLDLSRAGNGMSVATSAINTLLAGSGGAIVAMATGRATPTGRYRYSYSHMINGAIAGMVSSCAACYAMPFWAAYTTGAVAGFTYFALRALMSKVRGTEI